MNRLGGECIGPCRVFTAYSREPPDRKDKQLTNMFPCHNDGLGFYTCWSHVPNVPPHKKPVPR